VTISGPVLGDQLSGDPNLVLSGATGRDPLDLGDSPLEASRDLVGLDLGHRTALPLRGLPRALPEPPQHHDPVALVQRLGQVGSSLPPGVDPEERRRAVAPDAVLQHALGHGHSEVGHRRAVVGEAQLGVVKQVADNDGLVAAGHQALLY
jgi:hypothetical protein